ncbi:hypothetical protein AB9K41_28035 [Cribrihabitans sp. XS_ASV171]
MTLKFHHSGRYTAKEFTIEEVIGSLSAQRDLLEAGLVFLSELDPNFRYDSAKIRVESIATGSLGWDLLVEVYAEYQTQIEGRVIGGLEGMFGIDIPPELEAIVTLATIAVTYMVARYAYERVTRSKGGGEPSIYISGENNLVIQQVADAISSTPNDVEKALERSLPPATRKRLISPVADFLRPSRKERGASIEIKGAPDVTSEAIQEFPSDADIAAVNDSVNIDVEGAHVDIRGTDRDKHKQGWHAAIIDDDRFTRRMPMDLYPTVDPEALANHRSVRANLVVECERMADGKLKPKRIHLLSFEATEE